MGDVNFDSDYLIRSTSRSNKELYPVQVEKITGSDGRIHLAVKISEAIRLSGFQLSLDMAAFDSWQPVKGSLDLTDRNWSIEGTAFNVSWNSFDTDRSFQEGEILFTIDINKTAKEIDPENIRLNPGFDSEVYTTDLKRKSIGLTYRNTTADLQHKLYPNPADNYQVFDFYSPVSTKAIVTIQAIDGKEMESFEFDLQRGHTTFNHMLSDRYKSGIYVYQIRTKTQMITGRFEVIR